MGCAVIAQPLSRKLAALPPKKSKVMGARGCVWWQLGADLGACTRSDDL